MAGRYRNSNENNRSRFYILLSVIFVFVIFKWGIPYFVSVVAGNGAQRAAQEKDIIPPQTPIISALPEATNSSSIVIDGYTEANAALDFLVNDKISITDRAKDDGSFAVRVDIGAGSNRVQVRAADDSGNISNSLVKIVIYDDKPVEINISSPKDGTEFFGKNSQIIEISGSVNKPDSQVTINSSFVSVDKSGEFLQKFQLVSGENNIQIVATDKAQNTATETIKIVYTP